MNTKTDFTLLDLHISDNDTDLLDFCHEYENESDKEFYTIIGYIEEIIVDNAFIETLTNFMEKYWRVFDTSEENKLIYTDVFLSYQNTIEKFIEIKLLEKIEGFDIKKFEDELVKRKDDYDGEIFEILATFSDFLQFKEMFLDYKRMKEGSAIDFSNDVMIKPCNHEATYLLK